MSSKKRHVNAVASDSGSSCGSGSGAALPLRIPPSLEMQVPICRKYLKTSLITISLDNCAIILISL